MDYEEMIEELAERLESGENFSAWEMDFIQDIKAKLDENGHLDFLTDKQKEKIEETYEDDHTQPHWKR